MRKAGKEIRSVVIFILAVLVLTVLVVATLVRKPTLIMPPEPTETTDKRQSPENAFYTLEEATALIPKGRPIPSMVPDREYTQFKVPYEPEPHSIGQLLSIQRPDDDPKLVEFIQRCAPAVAKARDALRKPFYLCPEIRTWWTDVTYRAKQRDLGNMCVAAGLRQWDVDGFDADVLNCMLDAIRLGQMLASDGDRGDYSHGVSIEESALEAISARISADDPEETVRIALHEISALAHTEQPLVPHLEFGWRILDQTAGVPPPDPTGSEDSTLYPVSILQRTLWGWYMKRERRLVIENRSTLLDAAQLPYTEFRKWQNEHRPAEQPWLSNWFGHELETLMNTRTRRLAKYRGAQIVLALELYSRAYNEYPHTLSDLVPEVIDSLPDDPYCDKPFQYRRDGDVYLLYSVGQNLVDDGGDARRKKDIVIRKP